MSSDLLDALVALEEQKGISRDVLIEAIEAALVTAYKRNFNQAQNVRVDLNLDKGSMVVYSRKDVVEEVEDERLQISLEDAQRINPAFEIGDIVEQEVTPRNFGRIAAQTAKQVVTQRVREAERSGKRGRPALQDRRRRNRACGHRWRNHGPVCHAGRRDRRGRNDGADHRHERP